MDNMFHYYGNLVRRFFLLGAIIMLVTLPFLNALLPVSLFYSLFAIVVLSLVAGLTSPRKMWAIGLDEVIAVFAVMVFEYYAVSYYLEYSASSPLFIVNQLLALNFLVALYYNTKTLRGMI
jgi:hypothetical protein